MDISIAIPLYNEEESLPQLNSWIAKEDKRNKPSNIAQQAIEFLLLTKKF